MRPVKEINDEMLKLALYAACCEGQVEKAEDLDDPDYDMGPAMICGMMRMELLLEATAGDMESARALWNKGSALAKAAGRILDPFMDRIRAELEEEE